MFKVVLIYGGLGNNLFQYQKARELGLTNRSIITINLHSGEMRTWSNDETVGKIYLPKIVLKFIVFSRRITRKISTNRKEDKIYFGFVYDGYWQSYNSLGTLSFFKRERLLDLSVLDKYKDCVFLHIRGGDYLEGVNQHIYCRLTKDYYRKSLEYFNTRKLVVLTNDIEYATGLVNKLELTDEWSITWPNEAPLDVMYSCSGGVCANSTFSWWIAAVGEGSYVLPSKGFYAKESRWNFVFRNNIWIV